MAPLTGIAVANNWLISKLNLKIHSVKTTRMTANRCRLNKPLSDYPSHMVTTIENKMVRVSIEKPSFSTVAKEIRLAARCQKRKWLPFIVLEFTERKPRS